MNSYPIAWSSLVVAGNRVTGKLILARPKHVAASTHPKGASLQGYEVLYILNDEPNTISTEIFHLTTPSCIPSPAEWT